MSDFILTQNAVKKLARQLSSASPLESPISYMTALDKVSEAISGRKWNTLKSMLKPSRQDGTEDVYAGGQHSRAMDAGLIRRIYDNLGKREDMAALPKSIEDGSYEIIGPIDYPHME